MKPDPTGSRADSSPADSREFELRNTDELYRALVDQAPDAIFVCDHKFRLVEVNARACEMSGCSREEVLRRSVFDFMVPEDVVANPLKLDELKQGKPVVNERRLKRKNGTAIPVEITAKLLSDGRLQAIMRDISQRKRAEKERKKLDAALRQSEQRFRALIEHSHDAIALVGPDGDILYASPSTTNVIGYTPQELLQHNMVEFVRPDYLEVVRERLAESLRQPGVGISAESYVRHKDGGYRFLEGTLTNLVDEPSVGAIVSNYRDITEHKLAEDRLKLSENQLAEAQHLAHMGSWNWDLQRNTRTWSNELYHIFGLAPDSAAPSYEEGVLQFVHPDDRELLQRSVEASLRDRQPCDVTFRIIRPDKVERIIHGRGEVIKGDDGNPVRMFGTAQDITEQARSEQALIDAERHYRDIFENAREGIFQSTPEGQYLVANPALARMHGYESPEALIAGCQNISHQIYADPPRRAEFKRLLETAGVVTDFEIKTRQKDGSNLWVSVNARAVRDAEGVTLYYEGTSQDITDRKSAQEKSAAFATLARKLSGASTQLTAARIIAQTARDLFGWDACNLDLYDAERDWVFPLLNIDTVDGKEQDVTPHIKAGPPTARGRRVIDGRAELLLRDEPIEFDPHSIPFGDTSRPSASMMSVPIQNGPNVIGMLSIQSYTPRAYDEARLKDFVSLAEHCGEALNRIHAQGLLHESEERFRQLAEHLEDVVWIADRELTRLLYINPAYEKVFGRSSQSLYTDLQSWWDAVHPDDQDLVNQMLEQQRNNQYVPLEYRIIRPDGSIRWILRRAFPIRDQNGDIYRVAGLSQDITERKRVQDELRKSEEELRLFNLATNDMFWSWDFSTGNVMRSTGFERVFGYAEREIDPSISWWQERLHPDDRQRAIDAIQAAFKRGEKACTSEYRFRRRDGSYALISDRAYIVRDEAGNAVRAIGAMTDITERKEAEEALRESEERYRDLVENSRELICTHDLNGLVLSANPAAAAALGYEPEEYVGKKTIRDILIPEVRHQFDEYMARLRKEGSTSGIMLVQTKSGETRMWKYYNSLRTEGVTAPVVRGMARDITEELRARKALRHGEERYRELFENSRDAIYLHDMSGRYLSVNRAAEELSGYSRDEILGKNFTDFVAAEFIPDVQENFVKKLGTEGATMYEIEVIKKNGKRVPVEVSSRLLYKDDVPVAVQGTIRDISERKKTQAILREYSRRLVEAQEMERKKIARELHDDIGQILTAVRISLQSMQRTCQIADSARIDDNIVVIDEALERVRELSLELRPALLDDLGLAVALRWYLKRYCERTAIQGEVDSNFDDDMRLPRKLETACFRISQEALTNVVRHAEASHVRINLDRTEHEFRLTISDDGKGFDAAAVLASASAESFGLHGIEERAIGVGGCIEIQSRPGHGTQLIAHFPLRQKRRSSQS
ncbi:MAG TPA: PAS domain S-box protein [Pyrinomonadaceae bacterium]